jgi:hypothetical protein
MTISTEAPERKGESGEKKRSLDLSKRADARDRI